MPKRSSNDTQIRLFQLLQYGAAIELLMIGLYRWGDVSWLLIPIIVTFAGLLILALAMAPRTMGAVFGAMGLVFIGGFALLALPVYLLSNSDTEPNLVSVSLLIAWLVIVVIALVVAYMKVERYLLKRLGVKMGPRPKL